MKPQDGFRRARTDAGIIVHWFHTAWSTARQAAGRALRSRWLRAGGLALVLLVTAGSISYERYLASSNRPLEAYPLLSLEGYHRLLVFAPHCDDEALGAGGLIQAALRQGLNVHVVIVTAGDGYRNAAMVESRRPILRPEDYIKLAGRRQQESLNALTILGLGANDVTFLGYPERTLVTLWWEHWSSEHPYRSPFTKRERIEYPRAFRPNAPHSGETLLEVLRTILTAERPDLIVLPHPNDLHPDHAALSAFVLLALEIEKATEPALAPQLLGYLIHYGALYPQPYGLRPEAPLRPPRRLEDIGAWWVWRLSPEELSVKRKAVAAYTSQQRILSTFLDSFVRRNELYMAVDNVIALGIMETESAPEADSAILADDANLPRRADPKSDSILRRARSGGDIIGIHVLRLGNTVWVALDVRGHTSRAYEYNLYVRAFAPASTTTWHGRYGRVSTEGVTAYDHTVWYRLDFDELGHPDLLTLMATTRQRVELDRTAWYLVRLEENPLEQIGLSAP